MCAMSTLIHAVIAVPPFAFVTVIAFPVAPIGPLRTYVAKDAAFESL
jgi:hypothetical protein